MSYKYFCSESQNCRETKNSERYDLYFTVSSILNWQLRWLNMFFQRLKGLRYGPISCSHWGPPNTNAPYSYDTCVFKFLRICGSSGEPAVHNIYKFGINRAVVSCLFLSRYEVVAPPSSPQRWLTFVSDLLLLSAFGLASSHNLSQPGAFGSGCSW